ncbi:LacI family DNA-binding transcriptional regulator [Ruficoccus sp. ZRK36]|uniref:LacI family DNA-binding transcriptional regulator n=1 Tax=Ruficoccus sp. ZRK36 TaxID=2866311 RepID=UPI001C72BEE2|nr:LacI family DNA-binding transcriptional regulator [Ruficoccus sp. ZRK36]QYY35052.1 LacI family transcriptional regulator [Ruficoccus sp. ZRK36]
MKENPSTHPTLKTIAEKAGVSRMTVSCALRGTGRISPKTTARIKRIAAKMGYSPDARLSEVMTKVRGSRSRELLPLAWINGMANRRAYQEYSWLAPFYEGATKQARELGYRLEEFWLCEPNMTERRMSSIIASRGIRGVIIGHARPSIPSLDFDWRQFAGVSFEGAIVTPRLHQVMPDYQHNLMQALEQVRSMGYRRIGLSLHHIIDQSSHHAYLSALRYFHSQIPRAERIEPFIFAEFTPQALKKWLAKARPDAVIGHHAKLITWLTEAGCEIPSQVGVAHLSLDGDCEDWAGIWQHKCSIGEQAVAQVVSLIHAGRTGLPDLAYKTLIPGIWHNGPTLLPRDR